MVDHTSFVVWKVLSSCYYLSSLYHFLINLLTYCRCYYYQPLIQPGRGFCSLAVSMGLYLWTHFSFSQDHWFHFWNLFPRQYCGWGFCTWRYIRRIWQDHQQQEEMRLARCLSLLIFHLEQNNSNFCWIEEKNKQTILDGSVVFWILSNNNTRYYPLWFPDRAFDHLSTVWIAFIEFFLFVCLAFALEIKPSNRGFYRWTDLLHRLASIEQGKVE